MKKYITIIVSISICLVALYLYEGYGFKKANNEIDYRRVYSMYAYNILPERYFEEYGKYPENEKQIFDFIKIFDQEDSSVIIKNYLDDSFSKNNKGIVKYLPIYDRVSEKMVSYIFLSTGIDGKMDNILSDQDTLFYDDWWTKLKLYNYENGFGGPFQNKDYISYDDGCYKFNIYDRFFGNKDYIAFYKQILMNDSSLNFKT